MDRIAISWGAAASRLARYGLSDLQISDVMRRAKAAGTYDETRYYYPDDIDAEAEAYLDSVLIDDCGGID